ncbi:ABC transporter permease [Puia dinghuensis]|uniref:ABC transporter permease n=1 Tax=Puia dinghuensis TaxID=1792502 RepID=A0A8J2UDP0_9BACT|nr:ABC transporter permease [Puia dinghuensis]GGB02896.1 ABC transporter permease [Puia dinghuensis]
MKEQNHIWILMARKLSGEATPEEIAELERFQQQHPEMTYSLQLLADLWRAQKPADPADATEADQAFSRHLTRMTLRDLQPSAAETSMPGAVAPRTPSRPQTRDLIRNYFITTLRSLRRNKGFTAINISGLAIGLASAIVLILWIRNELSFDQFHQKSDRIYIALTRAPLDGRPDVESRTPSVMGPVLKTGYPRQIEEVVRMNWVHAFVFSVGDKHQDIEGYLCDPGFFRLFSFPLLEGDTATALQSPRGVVLTARLAKKLFGNVDPLGRTVNVDSTHNFVVTAVMKDQPPNTRFQFEYLLPWSYTKEVHWEEPRWQSASIFTYVLMRPGVTEAMANQAMRMVIHSHAPDVRSEVFFHPMRKWHLYSNFVDGQATGGEINFVHMLAVIAGFILLIACINYMNLSTARSIRRARETGIRKIVGAGRGSLICRFLGESLVLAVVAGVLALGIVIIALPWFDHLVDTRLTIPYGDAWFWLGGLGFILFTGLLAGSYPAFYLSAFKPVKVLRGHFKTIHALVTPRRVLVVFQFAFAITFIICTIVIYRQFDYTWNRKTGYDKTGLAFVYIKGDIARNFAPIRNDLLNSGVVSTLTRSDAPISEIWSWNDGYTWPGKDPWQRTAFIQYHTDRNYVTTMGLKLLAGRDIDIGKYPADSTAILLNQEAVRRMSLADPIGTMLKENGNTWHVVGVINDFVTGSLFNSIVPIVIRGSSPTASFGTLTFRFAEHPPIGESEAKLTAILKKYNPNYPLEYYYVDKYDKAKLQGDVHFGTLAALFAGMAIFISCLGLFGLSAYMAESRLREVGVRKVLGASIMRLTALLSKDFLILVMIAFIIASPVAWWFMRQWLDGIPYHINMNWWIFALTGLLSILIAIGTVGYQAVRAALTNPVLVLRTD